MQSDPRFCKSGRYNDVLPFKHHPKQQYESTINAYRTTHYRLRVHPLSVLTFKFKLARILHRRVRQQTSHHTNTHVHLPPSACRHQPSSHLSAAAGAATTLQLPSPTVQRAQYFSCSVRRPGDAAAGPRRPRPRPAAGPGASWTEAAGWGRVSGPQREMDGVVMQSGMPTGTVRDAQPLGDTIATAMVIFSNKRP